MNVRDLAIKFTSYAQYISSREWAREYSVLPLVLCGSRYRSGKAHTRVGKARLSNVHGLLMKSTTTELLLSQVPFASIWLHRLHHES